VTVHDPGHPLYRRTFRVHSIHRGDRSPTRGHVLVCYRDDALLRLPLHALVPEGDCPSVRTKLTAEAVRELVDAVRRFALPLRKEGRRGL
jgi:hypothetical protein